MHPLGTFEKVQPSDSFCTLFSYFFSQEAHALSEKKVLYKSRHWDCTFSNGKTFVHFRY